MTDQLWNTLLKFHREVAAPEIIGTLREEIASLDRKTQANFDAVWKRFDRLESEYQALRAAVQRLEERVIALEVRVAAVEQKLDRMALRSELLELKARVA